MSELSMLYLEEIAPKDSDGEDGVTETVFSDDAPEPVPETSPESPILEAEGAGEEPTSRKQRKKRKKKKRGGKTKRALQWSSRVLKGKARRPPGRGGASIVADEGKLYVFGGADRKAQYLDDLWCFDCARGSWTRLRTEGVGPQARADHACVNLGDGRLLIHGGSDHSQQRLFDDAFVLDLKLLRWSPLQTKGTGPFPRDGHLMLKTAPGEVFIFGGTSPAEGPQHDLYRLRFQEPTVAEWSPVLWEGAGPAERDMCAGCIVDLSSSLGLETEKRRVQSSHTLCEENLEKSKTEDATHDVDNTGSSSDIHLQDENSSSDATGLGIIVCGGRGATEDILDDAWLYKIRSGSWEKIKSMPGSLCAHAACTLKIGSEQIIAVQGGWNGNGAMGISGNIFALSWRDMGWRTVSISATPRFRSCACTGSNGADMYIFGGINEDEEIDDLLLVTAQGST